MTDTPKYVVKASARIKVPFFDIDVMGIAWHGHYVKYFELGRCALLDAIEYNYPQMRDSGFGWPVVDMRLKYVKPATFDREIDIHSELLEWENRLKIGYRIIDVVSGQTLTKGFTVQVAVAIETGEMAFITPPALHQALARYCELNGCVNAKEKKGC